MSCNIMQMETEMAWLIIFFLINQPSDNNVLKCDNWILNYSLQLQTQICSDNNNTNNNNNNYDNYNKR